MIVVLATCIVLVSLMLIEVLLSLSVSSRIKSCKRMQNAGESLASLVGASLASTRFCKEVANSVSEEVSQGGNKESDAPLKDCRGGSGGLLSGIFW